MTNPVADLEAQVDDGLAELIAQAQTELGELQRRRGKLDEQIAACTRKIRTWESVRGSLGTQPRRLHVVTAHEPTKREAVLAFLAEHTEEEFRLLDIRRALIARGWMTDNPKSIHALEVAALSMAERGEIRRARKGIYTLRPRPEDEWSDESVGVQSR